MRGQIIKIKISYKRFNFSYEINLLEHNLCIVKYLADFKVKKKKKNH